MKNRILMVVGVVVVAAGCGGLDLSRPWDKNHDGLVSACEGLDRFACGATRGCREEPVACIALCVDDGRGGCTSPCADQFECVPVRCEELDPNTCTSNPSCVLESAPVCEIACFAGGCPPCAQPRQFCRSKTLPEECASRSPYVCGLDPRCEVQQVTVCEAHDTATRSAGVDAEAAPVAPPPGCGGGCTTTLQCAPKVSDDCASRDVDSCERDRTCRLVGWACPAVCEDDGFGGCKPCPQPAVSCVPAYDDAPTPGTGTGGGEAPPPVR